MGEGALSGDSMRGGYSDITAFRPGWLGSGRCHPSRRPCRPITCDVESFAHIRIVAMPSVATGEFLE